MLHPKIPGPAACPRPRCAWSWREGCCWTLPKPAEPHGGCDLLAPSPSWPYMMDQVKKLKGVEMGAWPHLPVSPLSSTDKVTSCNPRPWSCCYCCSVAQSCPTLCSPVDCSLPGSSVHGISQARILEWVAMPSSRDPGIEPLHLLHCRFFTPEPRGKPQVSS